MLWPCPSPCMEGWWLLNKLTSVATYRRETVLARQQLTLAEGTRSRGAGIQHLATGAGKTAAATTSGLGPSDGLPRT